MPIETDVTYITDLDDGLPQPGDTKSQGDDHLRLIKHALKNTFPTATRPVNFHRTIIKNTNFNIVYGDDGTIFRVSAANNTNRLVVLPTLEVKDAGWSVDIVKVDATNGDVIIDGPTAGVLINGLDKITLTKRYSNAHILWTGYEYITANDDGMMIVRNMKADRLAGRSDTDGPMEEIEPAPGELEIKSGKLHIVGMGLIGPGQGLLTPDPGIPIPTGDNSKVTTIYYTPYHGKYAPVWNPTDSSWKMELFSELTLTLTSAHAVGKIYDIFMVYDKSTTPVKKLATGTAWETSTSRGTEETSTALTRSPLTGLYTNTNTMTVRNGGTTWTMDEKTGVYLGSVLIDDVAGRFSCDRALGQDRIWGLWNVWNRYPIAVELSFTPSSWTHTASTPVRPSAGNAIHRITLLSGLNETPVRAEFVQRVSAPVHASNQTTWYIGMGWNSITGVSKQEAHASSLLGSGFTNIWMMHATLAKTYWLGAAVISALEYSQFDAPSPTLTFVGTDSMMRTFHAG